MGSAHCDSNAVSDLLLSGSIGSCFDNQLGAYLAGLIESDGTIYVPYLSINAQGKATYPAIKIYGHIHDTPLFYKLQSMLGGTVVHPTGELSVHLSINDEYSIKSLIALINGHMRTPKIEALQRLADWYNAIDSTYTLPVLDLDMSPLHSNAWLAGFVEGDASFFIDARPTRVSTSVDIVQSRVNLELIARYKPIMEAIAGLLLTVIGSTIVKNASGTVSERLRCRTTAMAGSLIIASYLARYPLRSSKHLDFLAWREVLIMQVMRESVTDEGRLKASSIKATMNTKRTVYTWDHLDNFYTRLIRPLVKSE